MMKQFTECVLLALTLIALLAVGFIAGRATYEPQTDVQIQRDTIVRVDTIVHVKPVVRVERITDTLLVAVAKTDTIVKNDTIFATLPKVTREYGDENFRAVVSGYQPTLDIIEVFPKTVTISEIEIRTREASKVSFGLAVGPTVSYGFKGFDAGFGVTAGLCIRF